MRCYRKNEFMKRADFLHVHSGAIIFCLTENPTLPLRHKNLGVHCSFICFGFVSFVLIWANMFLAKNLELINLTAIFAG